MVPDRRDVDRVDAALDHGAPVPACRASLPTLGPAERYRRWLSVRRGQHRVVVGTRAAMFAPVHDLGLVVVWDDGDDLHAEPRAPYPHAREVAASVPRRPTRRLLVGGYARTAEGASLVAIRVGTQLAASAQQQCAAPPRASACRATSDASA